MSTPDPATGSSATSPDAADHPVGQRSDGQRSDGQRSDGQRFDGHRSDGQSSDGQSSDGNGPDGESRDGAGPDDPGPDAGNPATRSGELTALAQDLDPHAADRAGRPAHAVPSPTNRRDRRPGRSAGTGPLGLLSSGRRWVRDRAADAAVRGPSQPAWSGPARSGGLEQEDAHPTEVAPIQVRPAATRTTARVAAVAAIVVALVYGSAMLVWNVRTVLLTVFIGFFLAIGFDPLINRLERLLRRRGLAVLVFMVLLLGFLAVFSYLALRPAITQLSQLATNLPTYVDHIRHRDNQIGRFLSRPDINTRVNDFVATLPARAVGSASTVFGIIGAFLGGTVTTLAVLALMIYFMLSMPRMKRFAGAAVGGGEKASVLDEALGKVGGYVTGQLSICACAGIAAAIFFVIAHVPYAAVLAISVAILDAIPQLGATLGAVISTLVALTVSIPLAVATLAFILVYQQLENYFIAPRFFSRSVNLSAVTVLIAVLVGASVAGVTGALLALPITAALKTVLAYSFRDRLAEIARLETRGSGLPREAARHDA